MRGAALHHHTVDTRSCGNYAPSVTGCWLCSDTFHLPGYMTATSLAHVHKNTKSQGIEGPTATSSQEKGGHSAQQPPKEK